MTLIIMTILMTLNTVEINYNKITNNWLTCRHGAKLDNIHQQIFRRHDIQHNNIQHNDSQHNRLNCNTQLHDTQHYDTTK
jgi:hypothetical protein